jgi:hypothetical protein
LKISKTVAFSLALTGLVLCNCVLAQVPKDKLLAEQTPKLKAEEEKAPEQRTPKVFQQLAHEDLDQLKDILLKAHPGAIDSENPSVARWIQEGHLKAKSLISKIENYDDLLAVMRYYITGFRDGHLLYSDNVRSPSEPILVYGWAIEQKQDRFFVRSVLPTAAYDLPPIDAELLNCDRQPIRDILLHFVSPASNQLDNRSDRKRVVSVFGLSHLPTLQLKQCSFKWPSG